MTLTFAWAGLAIALLAAAFDWRKGRIPNALTLAALVLAPIAHAALASAREGWLHAAEMSLVGGALCGAVPLILWKFHAIGGGDVKLLAAVGAVLGPALGVETLFYSFLFATSFVLLRLSWNGSLLRTLGNGMLMIANPILPRSRRVAMRYELTESLRFGPAVCCGVALAIFLHGGLS